MKAGTLAAVLQLVFVVTLFALAKYAPKLVFIRNKGNRELRMSKRIWFILVIPMLLLPTFLINPLRRPFAGERGMENALLAFSVLVVFTALAFLLVRMALLSWMRWDRHKIEYRIWPLKVCRLDWDDVTEANIKRGNARFRAGRNEAALLPKWPGARELARYGRCRLKNNRSVIWSI